MVEEEVDEPDRDGTGRGGDGYGNEEPELTEEDVDLRWIHLDFRIKSEAHVTSQARIAAFLPSALPYVALARFSSRFHSPNVNLFALLSPHFLFSPMPLPKDSSPHGPALYHDVGYGHRRSTSQKSRKFRSPVVYSNPLVDLCVYY